MPGIQISRLLDGHDPSPRLLFPRGQPSFPTPIALDHRLPRHWLRHPPPTPALLRPHPYRLWPWSSGENLTLAVASFSSLLPRLGPAAASTPLGP